MTPDFIFMLTRDDATVGDALDLLDAVIAAGVRHIGFKDIGLPIAAQHHLADAIRDRGAAVYLEVVSLDAASERASAESAVALGVDVLMGGTRPDTVLRVISGHPIRYYPFAGKIFGHPGRLTGTIEEIVASAHALIARDGVDGVDLLAYRWHGYVPELVEAVVEAVGSKRIVVAGSIDRRERIETIIRAGANGFTVGTAALDGRFPAGSDLKAQIDYIAQVVAASLIRANAGTIVADPSLQRQGSWQRPGLQVQGAGEHRCVRLQ